ncbi:MAG: YfiR family protein [Nitrospira sp.]|nr:YfiR family protein [Nitrospira sp.]
MARVNHHTLARCRVRLARRQTTALELCRSPSGGLRWLALIVAFAMLWPAGGSLHAQPAGSAEYLLKAAFLYNIAKFVEWPASATPDSSAPVTFCMVGEAFGAAIDSVDGKQIHGRPIAIKRDPSVQSVKDCHLLFISETEFGKSAATLAAVKGSPVLTVCDAARCAEQGVMVNLQLTDNKVKLEINVDAVQLAPIKISSQLMKLARLVTHNR